MVPRLRRPNRKTGRLPALASMLGGYALAACLCSALAAERATPPMPVPRPRFETPAPAVRGPAPAPSALTPVPPAPPAPDANDPYVRLSEFPRDEQRAILRRCASEWDRRKSEGTLTGLLWRDFFGQCLPGR